MKYWEDNFTEESAAEYMKTYGEGVGSDTRHTLSQFLNASDSVLDVGCGPGWNLDHFKEFGPEIGDYKGLDYSNKFVKVANERYPGMFEYGDARDLKEPDESWDVVILQDILEHTNGFEKPVIEAIRVARKRVIVTFWRLIETDNPHINDDGDDTYGAIYDKREWETYLDKLGYKWVYIRSEPEANRQHDFYCLYKEPR